MNVRFYNAGDRIDEIFRFSDLEGGDIHFIGYWPFAPSKEAWIDVPTEMEFRNGTIAVRFVQDIKLKFGPRGIVMLDPQWDPAKENPETELWKYPVAPTKELVIERAEKLWQLYLRKIVEGHLADCQSAMAAGGAPRAASGFTKRALKLLNIQDPGELYFQNLQKGNTANNAGVSDETKAILASQGQMMQTMMMLMIQIAGGQKVDPEAIKKAMEPTKTPETLTTGVMTGKVAKPIDHTLRGSGPDADVFDRKVKDKGTRNKEAVAAL